MIDVHDLLLALRLSHAATLSFQAAPLNAHFSLNLQKCIGSREVALASTTEYDRIPRAATDPYSDELASRATLIAQTHAARTRASPPTDRRN
jgi:hypothetical protein